MPRSTPATIVLDTSVLLNFIKVGRMDLLGCLSVPLLIPDDVHAEVTRPEQRVMVDHAISSGMLTRESVSDIVEVALFADLARSGRLGPGERAAMAVALTRGLTVAIQERPAQAEMRRRDKQARIVTTEDLVVRAIHIGAISLPDADMLLAEWRARHRFASRITSFRDIISGA